LAEKIPMTREGYESLMREFKRFKDVERPQIVEELAKAAAHGDLSENAEYDAAKESLFGATVCLEDSDTGGKVTYKIVGADEADIKQRKISINAPIARALIGRKVGDCVEVKIPAGEKEYTILNVTFE